MQTKATFVASSAALLVASASAAAISVSDSSMPTLGGSPWYDWSSSAPGETSTDSWVAAWTPSASSAAAVVTSEWASASVWTPSPSSTSSWGAVWTPSAVSSSSSSWAAVWTPSPSPSSTSSWAAVWTPAPVSDSSSVPYENPFTIYTSMTNSWGVITGMPAVVTSQPTQAIPAGWTTTTIPVPPKSVNTTATTATTVTGFQQSTASVSIAVHTGGAAPASSNRMVGSASFGLCALSFVFGLF